MNSTAWRKSEERAFGMLVRGLFADKGLERNLGFWIPFALTVALALLGALISKGFYWGFVVVVPLSSIFLL